ncbi:MAG: hypothetical protein ACI945_002393, partial [Pseudohongiellaceae bacterium]
DGIHYWHQAGELSWLGLGSLISIGAALKSKQP